MAGYRQGRRIPTLRSIVARRRRQIKYTDFRAQKPIRQPAALVGSKLPGTVIR